MKKVYTILLAIVATIAASASTPTMTGGGGGMESATANVETPQFKPAPASDTQSRVAPAANAQWGAWYEYDEGRFFTYMSQQWFPEVSCKVMRRDDAANPGMYQLKFCGVFGTTIEGVAYDPIDFVITVDRNGEFGWEEQLLNAKYTYEGNTRNMWIPARSNTKPGNTFSTKRASAFFGLWVYAYEVDGLHYGVNVTDLQYVSLNYLSEGYHPYLSSNPYDADNVTVIVDEAIPQGWSVKALLTRGSTMIKKDGYTYYIGEAIAYNIMEMPMTQLKQGPNTLPFTEGPGNYTLWIIRYDPDGEWWSWSYIPVMNTGYDNYEWEPVGVGQLKVNLFKNIMDLAQFDEFVPNIAAGKYIEPYDVKIERRKDIPGVIRIVNPFGKDTPFGDIDNVDLHSERNGEIVIVNDIAQFLDRSRNYYSVLDTRNEPYPYEMDYTPGFYFMGRYTFTSMHDELMNDIDDDFFKLAVDDKKIKLGYVDDEGFFYELTLPSGGVEGIEADSESLPAEYFNLQGIRIDNPTSGNLYIRRQGDNVDKVIY